MNSRVTFFPSPCLWELERERGKEEGKKGMGEREKRKKICSSFLDTEPITVPEELPQECHSFLALPGRHALISGC